MKNTLLLTYSANILVRLLTVNMKNCPTPKIRKCATPSSGTSPLASYKEVPLPPPGILKDRKKLYPFYQVRAILIQLEIGIISF